MPGFWRSTGKKEVSGSRSLDLILKFVESVGFVGFIEFVEFVEFVEFIETGDWGRLDGLMVGGWMVRWLDGQ